MRDQGLSTLLATVILGVRIALGEPPLENYTPSEEMERLEVEITAGNALLRQLITDRNLFNQSCEIPQGLYLYHRNALARNGREELQTILHVVGKDGHMSTKRANGALTLEEMALLSPGLGQITVWNVLTPTVFLSLRSERASHVPHWDVVIPGKDFPTTESQRSIAWAGGMRPRDHHFNWGQVWSGGPVAFDLDQADVQVLDLGGGRFEIRAHSGSAQKLPSMFRAELIRTNDRLAFVESRFMRDHSANGGGGEYRFVELTPPNAACCSLRTAPSTIRTRIVRSPEESHPVHSAIATIGEAEVAFNLATAKSLVDVDETWVLADYDLIEVTLAQLLPSFEEEWMVTTNLAKRSTADPSQWESVKTWELSQRLSPEEVLLLPGK